MESSDNAFEMRLLIVLSAEIANIAIFSCFSIFIEIVVISRFPATRSNPITIDTASIAITAGAATIVERMPTPVIHNPIAVTLYWAYQHPFRTSRRCQHLQGRRGTRILRLLSVRWHAYPWTRWHPWCNRGAQRSPTGGRRGQRCRLVRIHVSVVVGQPCASTTSLC